MSMMLTFVVGLLVLAAGALAASVAVAIRVRLQGARQPQRDRTVRRLRAALCWGFVAAAATAVLVLAFDSAHQGWMGLPLALMPGLSASAGLLVIALAPRPRGAVGPTRSASLQRRGIWSIGERRDYLRPALAAVVAAAVFVITGLTGSPDSIGMPRAFSVQTHDGMNTASPYPGWYYAGPLLAVTALLLVTALLAIRRIAALPALQPADEGADRAWRRAAASAVSFDVTAGLLLYLAGVLLVAGSAIRSASWGATPAGGWLFAGGWALTGLAFATGALAVAGLGVGIGRIAQLGFVVRRPDALPR